MQIQITSSAYPTRRNFLAASVGALAATSLGNAQTGAPAAVKSGYAPVNGLKMYCEIHGAGEPLVLIHGGVVGITMFGPNVDALAKGRAGDRSGITGSWAYSGYRPADEL